MTAIEDPEVFCKQLLNELNESNETILGISENLTGSNETIFGTSENQTGPNPCEFRKYQFFFYVQNSEITNDITTFFLPHITL